MKKSAGMSMHVYWKRERTPRRLTYLYVFPADRLGGWLCDGNDHHGMAMLEKQKR